MGLHIALWSESMSSPCKALGLILSTKGRWREERRRKEKEREVCISELYLWDTFPWEAAGAEAVFRDGEIFQTHSFYTWSAGGSGHQQWDFLQESSQHIRGLAEHIYSLKGKVPFQLLRLPREGNIQVTVPSRGPWWASISYIRLYFAFTNAAQEAPVTSALLAPSKTPSIHYVIRCLSENLLWF